MPLILWLPEGERGDTANGSAGVAPVQIATLTENGDARAKKSSITGDRGTEVAKIRVPNG